MAYGTVKVDNITFTNGGIDQTVTVSGIVQSISGNITATGTIQAATIIGTSTVSGATVTGNAGQFTTATITSGVFASGTAAAPSVAFTGDLNTGIYSPGADQVAISTGGTERLRVNSGGLLGLATSNPQTLLSLLGGYQISWNHATDGTKYAEIYADTSSNLIFRNTNSQVERMRLDSSGRLGVGTSSPSEALTVSGKIQATTEFKSETGNDLRLNAGSANRDIFMQVNGSTLMTVQGSTGRVGIGTSSPGEKLTVDGNISLIATSPIVKGGFNLNIEAPNNIEIIADNDSSGSGYIDFRTQSSSRVRITNSGSVGVGTTSPAAPLDVNGAIYSRSSGVYADAITAYSGSSLAINAGSSNLNITVNASERLRIDSSGRVGIGTSSPSTFGAQLAVIGGSVHADRTIGGGAAQVQFSMGASSGANFGQIGNTGTRWSLGYGATANTIGTEVLVWNSSGNVGIGNTPSAKLDIKMSGATREDGVIIRRSSNNNHQIGLWTDSGEMYIDAVTDNPAGAGRLVFRRSLNSGTSFSESFRIDSDGRLLVGTSTSTYNISNQSKQAIVVTGDTNRGGLDITGYTGASSTGTAPEINFNRSSGSTDGSVSALDANPWRLGVIRFNGANGSGFGAGAEIAAHVDALAWGSGDHPSRLVFSTTADGASSPTERMRITNDGYFKFTNSGSYRGATSTYNEIVQGSNLNNLFVRCSHASFTSTNLLLDTVRAANSAYFFLYAASGDSADAEFILRGDGQAYADGSWNGGGADYAEYFEWSDSNPDEEDRRGISVVLDGEKIREAVAGEDPIGVISGNPSVVGDAAWNKWSGKYLRDEFGTYIQEDYEVVNDEGETVVQQRRKLNPAYDPDQEYIPREQRPEWDCVGLMGKLRIRKGQITGSRWIKMRDISDSVEEWLVR